jgi:hypothetical protein
MKKQTNFKKATSSDLNKTHKLFSRIGNESFMATVTEIRGGYVTKAILENGHVWIGFSRDVSIIVE